MYQSDPTQLVTFWFPNQLKRYFLESKGNSTQLNQKGYHLITLPETASSHLKMDAKMPQKETIVFQPSIFSCDFVSFRVPGTPSSNLHQLSQWPELWIPTKSTWNLIKVDLPSHNHDSMENGSLENDLPRLLLNPAEPWWWEGSVDLPSLKLTSPLKIGEPWKPGDSGLGNHHF